MWQKFISDLCKVVWYMLGNRAVWIFGFDWVGYLYNTTLIHYKSELEGNKKTLCENLVHYYIYARSGLSHIYSKRVGYGFQVDEKNNKQ